MRRERTMQLAEFAHHDRIHEIIKSIEETLSRSQSLYGVCAIILGYAISCNNVLDPLFLTFAILMAMNI